MLTSSAEGLRVAKAVTERVAEFLCAQVLVIDQQGIAIASSNPELVGLSFNSIYPPEAHYLRVSLPLNPQVGEVIVGEPLNGEVISPRLTQVLVEMVIEQTAVINALPNQHQLKNKFIYDLLHGLLDDEAAVLRQAKLLGLDLSPPRAVILIDASDYILMSGSSQHQQQTVETQLQLQAGVVISSVVGFFHLPNDIICAYIGDGEVAVLKASDTKNLVNWVNRADVPEQSNSSSAES